MVDKHYDLITGEVRDKTDEELFHEWLKSEWLENDDYENELENKINEEFN